MQLPIVSILIPLYNSEKYIGAAIESAINQSYRNTEIIIVDDGSTDDSYRIASGYVSDKIHLFSQKNKGGSAARNEAFRNCKGDYIQYLDADDMLDRFKIEKQMKLMRGEKNSIASGRWFSFYGDISDAVSNQLSIYKDYDIPISIIGDMWTKGEIMTNSSWLTPRYLIEQAGVWSESLKMNQDGEFFCRILLKAKRIYFSDNAKAYYRKGLTSNLSNPGFNRDKAASFLISLILMERHLCENKNDYKIRRGLANKYYMFIYGYYHVFPDLVSEAVDRVKALKMSPDLDNSGGENFKKLAYWMGYYNVLRLRRLLYRLRIVKIVL